MQNYPFSTNKTFIEVKDVQFSYESLDHKVLALQDLSLEIQPGEHVAIIGQNGSGKSTLARLLNALELPDKGTVCIDSLHLDSLENVYKVRQLCGLVFQNPDDQIVASSVEEDIAFGPENLGLSTPEIQKRVDEAIAKVDLLAYRQTAPQNLSGGQKQKLSIAGVLAMLPECIILDEASSMLDPQAARNLMQFIMRLCKEEGITLINITHNMEEAFLADHIFLLSGGKLLAEGSPLAIFNEREMLHKEQLSLPFHLEIYDTLRAYLNPAAAMSRESLIYHLTQKLKGIPPKLIATRLNAPQVKDFSQHSEILRVENLSYTYAEGTSRAFTALRNINLRVQQGEILVLCGHSGSGKSTLITHFNGILQPSSGSVHLGNLDTRNKQDLALIRQKVGLVFQYPERQLFAATVREDIAFGLKQLQMEPAAIEERIIETIQSLDISLDLLERSPFDLSGGQQRRVAIAGILAMHPELLILDEPAAGLDPLSHAKMIEQIQELNARGISIVMVTHNMEDALAVADHIAVLQGGELKALDTAAAIFRQNSLLKESGLALPLVLDFCRALSQALNVEIYNPNLSELCQGLSVLLEEARNV